jgi:hypothetical protein
MADTTAAGPRVPLFRVANPKYANHVYTTNADERKNLITKSKFKDQGVAGYVLDKEDPNGIPLYRLVHARRSDHVYTTNVAARDSLIAKQGYRNEGIACKVPLPNTPGSLPLYQLYQPGRTTHVYTTHAGERRKKLRTEGFKDHGIACYLYATAKADDVTVPPIKVINKTGGVDITDGDLWGNITRLLAGGDEHVCVLPMATFIKPVRVVNIVQLDTTVTATKTPCPPGSVNLPADVCDDLALDLSTGTAAWRLVEAPQDSKVPAGPAPVATPHTSWTEVSGAKWVGDSGAGAPGDYPYELTFDLSWSFANPQGEIRIRADDTAKVYLNDQPILETGSDAVSGAAEDPATVSLDDFADLLVVGENTLKVVLTNTNTVPNPAGFALSGTLTAERGATVATDVKEPTTTTMRGDPLTRPAP